jgi:hypothetical protein
VISAARERRPNTTHDDAPAAARAAAAAPMAAAHQPRLAHSFGRVAVDAERAPIQRVVTDPGSALDADELAKRLLPGGGEPPASEEAGPYGGPVGEEPLDYLERRGARQRHGAQVAGAAPMDSSHAAKAALGFSAAGGVASAVGTPAKGIGLAAEIANSQGVALQGAAVAAGASGVGNAIGAVGGLLNAGLAADRVRRGGERRSDAAWLGAAVPAELGSSAQNVGLGISSGGRVLGGALAAVAPTVTSGLTGAGGLLTGGIDVVRGGRNWYRAGQRRDALAAYAQGHEHIAATSQVNPAAARLQGAAAFGARAQDVKSKAGRATLGKGLLALGGGAAVVAGLAGAAAMATPIGWGLLGVAGLVGAGIAAYRMRQKHNIGKDLLDPKSDMAKQMAAAGIHYDLGKVPWYKSAGMHAYDRARAAISEHLAKRPEAASHPIHENLLKHLGLKKHSELSQSDGKRKEQIEEALDV